MRKINHVDIYKYTYCTYILLADGGLVGTTDAATVDDVVVRQLSQVVVESDFSFIRSRPVVVVVSIEERGDLCRPLSRESGVRGLQLLHGLGPRYFLLQTRCGGDERERHEIARDALCRRGLDQSYSSGILSFLLGDGRPVDYLQLR